jgi:hypothetical protein
MKVEICGTFNLFIEVIADDKEQAKEMALNYLHNDSTLLDFSFEQNNIEVY